MSVLELLWYNLKIYIINFFSNKNALGSGLREHASAIHALCYLRGQFKNPYFLSAVGSTLKSRLYFIFLSLQILINKDKSSSGASQLNNRLQVFQLFDKVLTKGSHCISYI